MSTSRTREKADGELFKSTGIDDNATSTAVTIDASENVGIGTASPFSNAKLQVKTGTNINAAFQTGTTETSGIKINAFNDAASVNIPLELNGSVTLLKTGETERLRIDSSGHAIIGGGITLGNGQTYSAANTLSDYETGTWTPRGTGIDTSNSVGYYTKVGNVCHTQMWIYANGSTNGTISGLPFTAGHTNNAIGVGTVGYINGSVTGIVSAGQNTSISLYNGTATGSMASGNQMHCAMTYRTT